MKHQAARRDGGERTKTGYYLLGELHGRWESPELRRRVAAFREERVRVFPELRHDDRCDAAAMALQRLRGWREFIPPLSFVVPPVRNLVEERWR